MGSANPEHKSEPASFPENLGITGEHSDGGTVELHQRCIASMLLAMRNETPKSLVSKLMDDEAQNKAQELADYLSKMVDDKGTAKRQRRHTLSFLSELVKSAQVFPRSMKIKGVQCDLTKRPDLSGGFGFIYRGIHEGRPVCIKVVHTDSVGIKKKQLRAHAGELTMWGHLSHPNVIAFLGAYISKEEVPRICIVSPWMDNGSLRSYLEEDVEKRDPKVHPKLLVRDIISGLQYLHDFGIIHADLKTKNVLVSKNGRAMVADFGISRPSVTLAMSLTNDTAGPVWWKAPELLLDDEETSFKSDIWAFACTCYEIITCTTPFGQYNNPQKLKKAFKSGRKMGLIIPSKPSNPGFGWDEDVWLVAMECWKIDPEDRPGALELLKNINEFGCLDGRSPDPEYSKRRSRPKIEYERVLSILDEIHSSPAGQKSDETIDVVDEFVPPPPQIPVHFRESLSGLAGNSTNVTTVAMAAKKLNPQDTQTLMDALDLVLEEDPSFIDYNNPVMKLLTTLMVSTHTCPQRYKLRRLRYDPSLIAEDRFGKVYKGRDLDVFVNIVTNSNNVVNIFQFLGLWAHSSHPNILPFYGVFDEVVNGIPRFCLVSPHMKNGTLSDYAPRHPQKYRIPLISDVIEGLDYLHNINMSRNNLRPDTILISDEGRALVTSFSATLVVTGPTQANTSRSSASYAIRFQAPEPGQASREADVWSFGCLCYEVLSRKLPYYQYREKDDVQYAISRGECPGRPKNADDNIDVIDDWFWELIMGCCRFEPGDRLTVAEIKKLLEDLRIQDDRPDAQKLPGTAIVSLRKHPDIEWSSVKQILGQIQVEVFRSSLAKLVQNHIKDVAAEVIKLQPSDVQTLVDFLDVTLKHHLKITDERNRILAFLSRIATLARKFPRSHELKGIKYDPKPIAEGGSGKVHRGYSDPTICVKVLTRINDPLASIDYIKGLIIWAHSSHPNILPFYGVFFDDLQQICLVSPYMTKGNLRDYARQLPQKSRILLLMDTIQGLDYLHGLGVVHTDLKGENVLISDEGRGLITDFGAFHVITTATRGGPTSTAVAYTLRFTAPEIIQDEILRMRPTKECDIWSFGCLCYEVLSRKLPYHEYKIDAQVVGALFRGQPPKRPGPANDDTDTDDDDDWDDLDDTAWGLITTCLTPKPEDRPGTSHIQELIRDMRAWDSRPAARGISSAEILKQKSHIDVNLNRVGALLDHLQILFLARSIYRYSDQEVVTAVAKLDDDDASTLTRFCALALKNHLSITDQRRLLAIHSAVTASRERFQAGYILSTRPQYHREVVGVGSFGKVYRGTELNICVKVTKFSQINTNMIMQWHKALVPWAHSSHPNILPFLGVFLKSGGYLVSPFIENGNLHNYAPSLPQLSRVLLVSDVIEGLMYLHELGIIHSNLKTQNILISDEGRGLITDFRPYHVNIAAATDGPTGSFITSTLRFTAPELVKDSQMLPTTESDVWSVGCLFYEVLSLKVPYYQYTQDSEIRSALSRGELVIRPIPKDGDGDSIDDRFWELIMQSCALEPNRRSKLEDIQSWFTNLGLEDDRSAAKPLPAAEVLKNRRQYSNVDLLHVATVLEKLKAQIPR